MKKILIIILFYFLYNDVVKSQIYQHFIFKNNQMIYDEVKQPIAERALSEYYYNNIDSSAFYYEKLLLIDSLYYQGYYNLAKVYSLKRDTNKALLNLMKYVSYSGLKCKCSYISDELFGFINDSLYSKIKKTCQFEFDKYVKEKHIKQPELLNKLENIEGKEQEILGNRTLQNFPAQRDKFLKENFMSFAQIIDTVNFPNEFEIGKGTSLVQLIVLHADYYPAIQLSLGNKLLKQSKKGYSKKMSAYIIDRALKNQNKPQLYGTMLIKTSKGDELYNCDNYLKMKKRRKKLKFQSIDDYIKNKSITK